ncbi:hypothetical protein [Planomicrobium sp. CPCC 101110]|uniref:hypothetical protein n=1 Tax=Planomicrobium sp. CPCC 101110 TaxID=2599619 RepID=UPI0011B3D70D|nr:hypothetical protein [Planomicrobium sp. CPCC 101110]TWT25324.1 hypothetical protein FQV30_13260 [Planomicrobium sp. CPCC 101110]
MKYVRFFVYQFVFVFVFFNIFAIFDYFIGPPMTRVDWIAVAVSIPFLLLMPKVFEVHSTKFGSVHWFIKALFSIPPFIGALLFAGFIGLFG